MQVIVLIKKENVQLEYNLRPPPPLAPPIHPQRHYSDQICTAGTKLQLPSPPVRPYPQDISQSPPYYPFSLLRNNKFGAWVQIWHIFCCYHLPDFLYYIWQISTYYEPRVFPSDRTIITCAMLGITFSLMPPCIMVMAVVVRCSASVSGSPIGQNRWLNGPHNNCPGFEFTCEDCRHSTGEQPQIGEYYLNK